MEKGRRKLVETPTAIHEKEVVAFFSRQDGDRYRRTEEHFGLSHGAVYRIVVAHEARVHEAKIRQRHDELRKLRSEFTRLAMNRVEKADVLSYLRGVASGAVRLHVTSPPYNIGRAYVDSPAADAMGFVAYTGWMRQVLAEMVRTLEPGGTLCLQVGSTKDEDGILVPLDVVFHEDLKRLKMTFQSRVAWEVPHGLTPKGRLAERYETVMVFSKGEQRTFNPNGVRTPQLNPSKRHFKGPKRGRLSGHPFGAWPTNVWRIPTVRHNHPEKTDHPAQFPEELARRAILLYSMPGDVVCDIFAGSGTTQVVAKKTFRRFIGCDILFEAERGARIDAAEPDHFSRLPGVTPESIAIWQAEARAVQVAADAVDEEKLRAITLETFAEAKGGEP